MRAFRSGHARNDCADIEFDGLCVIDATGFRNSEEPLSFVIFANEGDVRFIATRLTEVLERFVVDREEAHRGTVFRRHVRDGRAIGEGEGFGTFAEELNEFTDHFGFAEDFGEAQGEVGGGDAFTEAAF